MILPQSIMVPIQDVASEIGVPVQWLISLIGFESNFNPQAKNPTSSARGLIQFIDATARTMGYVDSADLVAQHPTFSAQMYGPVLTYLRRYMPYDNSQELYMAVFYPAARDWEPNREFPEWAQQANPGIVTVGDYVALVEANATDVIPAAGAFAAAITDYPKTWKILALAAVALTVVYFTNKS